MSKQINVDELSPETRTQLGLTEYNDVDVRVSALGKTLVIVSKLTVIDALWVLKTAVAHVRGRRNISEKSFGKKGGAIPPSTG